MKLLRQWGIIMAICFIGEFLSKALHLPLPGNVTGMIILFILLCTKAIKVEMVEEASNFLLDHLAFFFIPAGAGLIACLDLLNGKWTAFLLVCLITTTIVLIVTGHIVQAVKKLENKLRK